MNIESNFSRIDKLIKDKSHENEFDLKYLPVISLMIKQEILNIMTSDINRDVKSPISHLENLIINVAKDDRGFNQTSFSTKSGERAYITNPERSCHLSERNIIDMTNQVLQEDSDIDGVESATQCVTSMIKETFETNDSKKKLNDEINNFLEKDLENILIKDLSVIEDGLELIDNQYSVIDGYIDILAKDKDGKLCIIELKNSKSDIKIIQQCVYYPTQFDEEVRMITIAPGYNRKLSTSLKSLKFVEMKTFNFTENGISINNY